ncbi:MAG: pentapeptide repeat-containing protein [Bacteroidota bacterium]
MEKPYSSDQVFEHIRALPVGEYEACTFRKCDFESADFKNIQLVDCRFEDCNLSLVKLSAASFQKVYFQSCKMQGLRFEACNPFLFEVHFKTCVLNLSSFYQVNGKGSTFQYCTLSEVDFTEANCSGVKFEECDLAGALFDRTNLEKADFRTAYNYRISPTINRLKKAKFSQEGLAGLLSDFGIEIS